MTIVIKPCTASNQDLLFTKVLVIEALEVVSPISEFMNLIEYHE